MFLVTARFSAHSRSIKLLSYDVLLQITQYLLSPKAGQAFGKWASDTLKTGGVIDKDTIIRTVGQLEGYAELKLHSPRTIPGSLITTTLGLPVESAEQTNYLIMLTHNNQGLEEVFF